MWHLNGNINQQNNMKRIIYFFVIALTIASCGSSEIKEKQSENFELSGNQKYNKEDFKGALDDFNKHLEKNPQDTSAYFNRARAKAMLGDYQGSLNDNTKTLELDPSYEKALHNRALDKQELKDEKGAIDDYSTLINLKPDNISEIYQKRGSLKHLLNDSIGAIEDLNKAIEINPHNSDAFVSRALVYFDYLPDSAINDLNKAIEINKENASAYYVRGILNLKQKNKKEVCSDLQKAVSMNYEPAKRYYEKYCVLPPNTHIHGDIIDFGNYTLQVTNFEEKPYYNYEFKPKSGNKLVAVEFFMNNTGQSKIEYNALEFKLMDENSYEYNTVTFGFKKPYFSSGDIQSNRKARGWITFEVPKESKQFEVKYTPGLFTGNTDYFIRLFDNIE